MLYFLNFHMALFSRFINLILLLCMAVACGIVDHILEARDYPRGAPWLIGDNQSNDNPQINGFFTAIFALITFVFFHQMPNGAMLPNDR